MGERLIELNYTASSEEIYESLTCLAWKTEGVRKQVQIAILSMIGLISMFIYHRNVNQPHYILITFCCVGIMFFILYYVPLRRRRTANKLAARGSDYYVKIDKKGNIYDHLGESLSLNSDKVRIFESGQVFTITQRNGFTFCIPKKQMDPVHINQIYQLLKNINKQWMYVYL